LFRGFGYYWLEKDNTPENVYYSMKERLELALCRKGKRQKTEKKKAVNAMRKKTLAPTWKRSKFKTKSGT